MRPLETLHNNLCFKNLNNFLTRMIDTNKANGSLKGQDQLKRSLSYAQQISNSFDVSCPSLNLEKLDLKKDAK